MIRPPTAPADLKSLRQALSHFAASRHWFKLAELFGVDMAEQFRRIDGNERICNAVIAALENAKDDVP